MLAFELIQRRIAEAKEPNLVVRRDMQPPARFGGCSKEAMDHVLHVVQLGLHVLLPVSGSTLELVQLVPVDAGTMVGKSAFFLKSRRVALRPGLGTCLEVVIAAISRRAVDASAFAWTTQTGVTCL